MRFTLQALKEYIDQAPASMTHPPANGTGLRDLWESLPQQSLAMLRAIEKTVLSIEQENAGFAPIDGLAKLAGEAPSIFAQRKRKLEEAQRRRQTTRQKKAS